jgi:hypothetical protein
MSSFESMTGTITPMHWSLHGGSDPDECIHDYGNINRCNGTNIMAERVRTHILMFVLHVFSFSLIENDIIIASPCFHYFSMFLCLWKKELPV